VKKVASVVTPAKKVKPEMKEADAEETRGEKRRGDSIGGERPQKIPRLELSPSALRSIASQVGSITQNFNFHISGDLGQPY